MVIAYSARGASGFGAAAAMPLLGLVIPLKILVPAWTLIGTTFPPRVTATPREEMAIAVSGVVRRLDIFLSFGVSGIGLSMMGSYRNGAFADVTLVTFALCAGASVVQIAIQRTSEQTWPGS